MKILKITDLKEMLNNTEKLYENRPAYKIREEEQKYKIITHKQLRKMVNALGTQLIELGLGGKRIAIIGENRYEWQIAYLSVVCGTGTVVPLDKSLPENEIKRLIQRADVEAIFYSEKYEEKLKKIYKSKDTKLKYLFSMADINELIEKGQEQIKQGNRKFLDAQINPEEMNIMLFTSGTTSESKAVALSHKNICTNLMDLAQSLQIDENDHTLSFLPLHHVFECTVGFLLSIYRGAQISFCDGIKYIVENFNEYQISFASFVPAIYENIYKNMMRKFEKQGRLEEIQKLIQEHKNDTIKQKKKVFKEIHEMFGGNIKILITGAAAIDGKVAQGYRDFGINLCQGYGLTETSPVVAIETKTEHRLGSIGKTLPSLKTKIKNPNEEGIGELLVKGPTVMLGYYKNKEATDEVIQDKWFHTGDLAKIDKDGYIFISGRKKSVIVLKNGKNIFPEEMENLINRIQGVKESFVFGKSIKEDKNDVKIYAKIVYDKEIFDTATEKEIYEKINNQIKVINHTMPPYKGIKGILLTQTPLIKTTTSKIKRQEEMKTIL